MSKRKREHLIDVKENNLRSKQSLLRDDRQGEKREREERREKQREKEGKVASQTLFSPFLPLLTNRQRDYREKERTRESERGHNIHLNFSNYISCHARLQKVEWLQQPVFFSCRLL